MDNKPGSFSRLKKGIKSLWKRNKRREGGTEAGEHGERVDPAGPSPQAEPHVDPQPVPAGGSENDQELRREASIGGREVSQHPETEVAVGRGSDGNGVGELEQFQLPPSTSIPFGGNPDSELSDLAVTSERGNSWRIMDKDWDNSEPPPKIAAIGATF